MQITYLHQYFNTLDMAGGTRSFEMASRLVKSGHEVNMITSFRKPHSDKDWFQTRERGIKVHWLPVIYSNEMSYFARILAFIKFAHSSSKQAAKLKADVIFATSTPLTIALPAVYASRKLGIPLVFEVRDLWPELPIAIGAIRNPLIKVICKKLEKWAYKNSEAVVALSPGMKDGVVAAGYPEKRVAVIPNSSDNIHFDVPRELGEEFKKARPWLGSGPLIVYAGTLGLINGVNYLVKLAVILIKIDPSIRVLIIGEGAEKKNIEREAREAGVLGINLFIENEVSKAQIPAALAAADIACSLFIDLPEMRANSANKFFDALASSKVVLLNYGGWQAGLVKAVDCGIVTWKLSLDQAAELIVEKLGNTSWMKEAASNSRRLALKAFDRSVLCEQLEKVLELAVIGRGIEAASVAPGDYTHLKN